MIHNFSNSKSIINVFISELRNIEVQRDSMRFRRNLERISSLMAYEISKHLEYDQIDVTTPLGESKSDALKNQPVLATILRAGLAMHHGLLDIFDKGDNAFVSAFRKHSSAEDFEIFVEYIAAPSIDGRTLIICDPMLATGNSMVTVYRALLKHGKPAKVHIVAAIAHTDAIKLVQEHLPSNTEFWIGAIDQELTAQSYIVPGIGDAGDLAYGIKL